MADLTFYKNCQPVQLADDVAGAPITSTDLVTKRGQNVVPLHDYSLNKNWPAVSASLATNATGNIDLTPAANKILDITSLFSSCGRLQTTAQPVPRVRLIWDATGTPDTLFDGYISQQYEVKILRRVIQNASATKVLRITVTNGNQQAMIFRFNTVYQEV